MLTPAALVADAFAAGVRLFALTDHDTLAGYRDVMAAGGPPADMTLVPGSRCNALVTRDLGLWEGELHILGFGMDPDDEAFETTLTTQRDQRRCAVLADRRSAALDRVPDRYPRHRARS